MSLIWQHTAINLELTDNDKIRHTVKKLQPKLSEHQNRKISGAFEEVSKDDDCGIIWPLLVAIAFKESSLITNTVGKSNPKTKDYGLMQINNKNAVKDGLKIRQLLKDEKYNILQGCKILKKTKDKYSKKIKYWIGLYNAGTNLKKKEVVDRAKKYDNDIRYILKNKIGYRAGF